jgi:hypothetical protein
MRKLFFDKFEFIRPQYPIEIRLQYPQNFWDAEHLGEGRIVAHFRSAVPDALLFEADSLDATIQREPDRTIAILLPASATALMACTKVVVFDFARFDGSVKRAIPGRVTWPVKRTVTRDVG